jgi:hypothetical protein
VCHFSHQQVGRPTRTDSMKTDLQVCSKSNLMPAHEMSYN